MQYTSGSWLKELFARYHTESPRSMSYGLFSETVYANFTETKNISGILRGKEVAHSLFIRPILTNHSGLLITFAVISKGTPSQISVGLTVEIWRVILPHEFQCATGNARLRSAEIGSRDQPNC
ncbi:hypothetical protein ALC62_05995 [Cyphomyrmex costatus]|uniref:Uncharacterized protein n=1 Tax=Cyphomyrmex costatus TaxID=456900 RepID=A0A195CQW6_9HYME|nr:hypothetical protein ALC62_05995 [Cyphomyrmex costatus]